MILKGDHPAAEVQLTPTRHASFRNWVEIATYLSMRLVSVGLFSVTTATWLDRRQEIRRGNSWRL